MRAACLAVVVSVAAAMWACSGGAPLSPSGLSSMTTGVPGRVADEHEPMPPAPPPPDPAPPDPAPPASPVPPADPTAPVAVSIIGTSGPFAFDPNPLTAVMGNMLVWTNNDTRIHHIQLEDGTDVGILRPGESSLPVPLTTETSSYICALHPSMVGQINRQIPVEEDPYPAYGLRRPQR